MQPATRVEPRSEQIVPCNRDIAGDFFVLVRGAAGLARNLKTVQAPTAPRLICGRKPCAAEKQSLEMGAARLARNLK